MEGAAVAEEESAVMAEAQSLIIAERWGDAL